MLVPKCIYQKSIFAKCTWLVSSKLCDFIFHFKIPMENVIEWVLAGFAQGSSLFLTNGLQLLKDFPPTKLRISQVLLQSISTKHTQTVSSLHHRVGGDFLLNQQITQTLLGDHRFWWFWWPDHRLRWLWRSNVAEGCRSYEVCHFYSFPPSK